MSQDRPPLLRVLVLAAGAAAIGLGFIAWADRAEERMQIQADVPVAERIRVEVLNGGERRGMARAATDQLRDAGFDVVGLGNAGGFDRDSSLVLDRVGRLDWASSIAGSLGISEVRTELDSTRWVDVTVLLGGEWEPMGLENPSEEEEPVYRWWDPRRIWR